eukprot:TRINITY_DN685_c3_g1_i1.p1 TRINITY_DN685_c3_g1~~TRINITY_DN685_c3_g1_i1.p1  ORF type:complete len:504 (+),score=57.51 TRINITY_DN685_c3_g1_i1:27-1514(+)
MPGGLYDLQAITGGGLSNLRIGLHGSDKECYGVVWDVTNEEETMSMVKGCVVDGGRVEFEVIGPLAEGWGEKQCLVFTGDEVFGNESTGTRDDDGLLLSGMWYGQARAATPEVPTNPIKWYFAILKDGSCIGSGHLSSNVNSSMHFVIQGTYDNTTRQINFSKKYFVNDVVVEYRGAVGMSMNSIQGEWHNVAYRNSGPFEAELKNSYVPLEPPVFKQHGLYKGTVDGVDVLCNLQCNSSGREFGFFGVLVKWVDGRAARDSLTVFTGDCQSNGHATVTNIQGTLRHAFTDTQLLITEDTLLGDGLAYTRTTENLKVNGVWEGVATCPDPNVPQNPINWCLAILTDGSCMGCGLLVKSDKAFPYILTGTCEFDTQKIRLLKKYLQLETTVQYEGTIDRSRKVLKGNWRNDSCRQRGDFVADLVECEPITNTLPPAAEEAQRPSETTDLECGVCLDKKKDVVLVPCGHLLCDTCAHEVTECPYCRHKIGSRMKVYL